MVMECELPLSLAFLWIRLLMIVVATSFSVIPVSAQQPEIEKAASKIAETLVKDHARRVIVSDFFGPDREILTELGRDLAGELSNSLAASAPNLVILPRSNLEIQFSRYDNIAVINGPLFRLDSPLDLNPTASNPDNVEEQEGATELAMLAQADTVIVGRIGRKRNKLKISLHVYLLSNVSFFQTGAGQVHGSDGGELWNHEANLKIPITSEYQQKMTQILRRLPKDNFGLSAGAGQRGPELLNSECLECRVVPLNTGAIFFLILRVDPDGVVSVYSISSSPSTLNSETVKPAIPDQASGPIADSIKAAVSNWRFKPFFVDKGQAPFQYRFLVLDGIHHRVDLLPFVVPKIK